MAYSRNSLPRWTPDAYRQRPSEFDPRLAEVVCERVANGEVLAEICQDRDYPLPATFLRWVRQDPSTESLWRQAQIDRLDVVSEECVLIADTATDAIMVGNALKARHWLAERLNPKKYAQRTISHGLSGEDSDADAGVDYGSEVRRKLDAMAERRKQDDPVPAG